jgi:hypothetical protein
VDEVNHDWERDAANDSTPTRGDVGAQDVQTPAPPQAIADSTGYDTAVTPLSRQDEPFAEIPASGRDSRGRFLAGHPGPALRHGMRSRLVATGALASPDLLAELAAQRAELEADQGGADGLSVTRRNLIPRYVELNAILDHLAERLLTEGPITAKGRTRAALSAYLAALDRQVRLAQLLGLERRARGVESMSIHDYVRRQETE